LAPGLPMLQVDPIQVTRRLHAEPVVASADVRRVYPGAVWIDLRERTPELRVLAGNIQALVDAKNVVIETGPPQAPAAVLPLVRVTSAIPQPGQILMDPGLSRARAFLRQMKAADLPVEQVIEINTAAAYMLSVHLVDGRRVLFSADNTETQLRIFRDLTNAPSMGDVLKAGKVLDLRAAVAEDGRVVVRP